MSYRKVYNKAILVFVLAIMVGVLIPSTSFAEGKVKVEAVGFFSHFPMQPTKEAIQSACQKFGDKVELTLHDEDTQEGQEFLSKVGLSGHIPMAIYVDGELSHSVDGKNVAFRDFVGGSWRGEDLEKVLELRIKGVETAAKDQDSQSTDQTGATPQTSFLEDGYGQYDTNTQDSVSDSSNLFIYVSLGVLALLVIAVFIFLFSDRNFIKKRRG